MNRKQKRAQAACDRWNAANPIGTEVSLKRDNGQIEKTETTSVAYVSNAGYPVIHLENVSGYYLLDRVTVTATNNRSNTNATAG
jgi:hypothetical protein